MFSKLLIANRGEIAARIIRTCRKMGVRTVAVYSTADAGAFHVREADEAVLIGPPAPAESYLRAGAIIEAALTTGAEAIHPGFGFLSERPHFARMVAESGLIFVGPSPEAMEQMGSKTAARATMEAAGVPVVPGYQGGDAEGMRDSAERMGYPVLVKAAAGGGGKGMRVVHSAVELPEAIASAQREAQNAFGDGSVFLEKYVHEPRHIEFQILADHHGNTLHLFERDCSVQRRYQKIIEESPSPFVSPALREQMGRAAVTAARAVNYVNAGTIEFIADGAGNYYFLEMNTRLQVEHPVTEAVTGLDLVEWQLRVAAGEALPFAQTELRQNGHALECRVYAEDPANNFLPSTGKVLLAEEPQGVRVDAGVKSGDAVTIHYDPMISKVIVHASDRPAAIRRMIAALGEYTILGLSTNLAYLRALLSHPRFQAEGATTHFIPQYMNEWTADGEIASDDALVALAISDLLAQQKAEATSPLYAGDPYNPWRLGDRFRDGA